MFPKTAAELFVSAEQCFTRLRETFLGTSRGENSRKQAHLGTPKKEKVRARRRPKKRPSSDPKTDVQPAQTNKRVKLDRESDCCGFPTSPHSVGLNNKSKHDAQTCSYTTKQQPHKDALCLRASPLQYPRNHAPIDSLSGKAGIVKARSAEPVRVAKPANRRRKANQHDDRTCQVETSQKTASPNSHKRKRLSTTEKIRNPYRTPSPPARRSPQAGVDRDKHGDDPNISPLNLSNEKTPEEPKSLLLTPKASRHRYFDDTFKPINFFYINEQSNDLVPCGATSQPIWNPADLTIPPALSTPPPDLKEPDHDIAILKSSSIVMSPCSSFGAIGEGFVLGED